MFFLLTTFLTEIDNEIFSENALVQKSTFQHRFNPNYKDYPHKSQEKAVWGRNRQESIADLVAKEIGGEYHDSIAQHIAAVIQKIYKTYQKEMEQDGIIKGQLMVIRGGGRQGENAPWRIVYKWLWETKYYRWLQDYIWDSWKDKAQNNIAWMEFCRPAEYPSKGMKVPQPLPKETIPINTPLSLKINLDSPGSYLLLFNRGLDDRGNTTKYLVTPSQAFAPSYQLVEKSILLPLEDAMLQDMDFDAVGKEEYIGIVIDKALTLPWLNPYPEEPVLEWQGKHLEQVWEQLHTQDHWRVFYRDFNVVRDCL